MGGRSPWVRPRSDHGFCALQHRLSLTEPHRAPLYSVCDRWSGESGRQETRSLPPWHDHHSTTALLLFAHWRQRSRDGFLVPTLAGWWFGDLADNLHSRTGMEVVRRCPMAFAGWTQGTWAPLMWGTQGAMQPCICIYRAANQHASLGKIACVSMRLGSGAYELAGAAQ